MGYTRTVAAADATRIRDIRLVLWVILGLNLAVAAAKYFYGVYNGSISMQADGFHSLFDGTSNVIGLIGLAVAIRPPDRDHPYGHAKYETYAAA
jgi:divalent metal cation (Fe/Co/Zn/Cd) transporter